MDIEVDLRGFHEVEADALVVSVFDGEKPDHGALKELDERSGGILSEVIGTGEMRGKKGETVFIHQPGRIKARRLLLAGAGKRDEFQAEAASKYAGTAARLLRGKGARTIAFVRRSDLDIGRSAQAVVEGVLIALFEPDKYKTTDRQDEHIDRVILIGAEPGQAEALGRAIERGKIIGEAVNLARELSNEPSSTLTPTELANRAVKTAKSCGLEAQILDGHRMKELGMGALLGVSQGSDQPPTLTVLRYKPQSPAANEVIGVIGKGITFDSGGISIKPADGMDRMKYDMSGAAATLATMSAIARLKPAINVIGLMPSSENMPSGSAYKPGDVLRAMSGTTIEVINTDAEGRLVLADAISYAKSLGATRLIDMATLTGACPVALGTINAAILGNDQMFVDDMRGAAKTVGERLWQLPMDEEYRDLIKSDIADIKNSGGRYGGTITAAFFLKEFVGDTPWVHLDIAGTAWESDRKPYIAKGPTGVAIKTVIKYIEGRAAS
ncbi:MAG TPA: leucyl aminopeptidase [Blastocatellia bacterium]|nr:leucyl aminopeptidase [Blastocatellia bacterium]